MLWKNISIALITKLGSSSNFAGTPLPGEAHAPKSMFDDCDKEWFAEKPPTPMPKDYKEHPDRDLVFLLLSHYKN